MESANQGRGESSLRAPGMGRRAPVALWPGDPGDLGGGWWWEAAWRAAVRGGPSWGQRFQGPAVGAGGPVCVCVPSRTPQPGVCGSLGLFWVSIRRCWAEEGFWRGRARCFCGL